MNLDAHWTHYKRTLQFDIFEQLDSDWLTTDRLMISWLCEERTDSDAGFLDFGTKVLLRRAVVPRLLCEYVTKPEKMSLI